MAACDSAGSVAVVGPPCCRWGGETVLIVENERGFCYARRRTGRSDTSRSGSSGWSTRLRRVRSQLGLILLIVWAPNSGQLNLARPCEIVPLNRWCSPPHLLSVSVNALADRVSRCSLPPGELHFAAALELPAPPATFRCRACNSVTAALPSVEDSCSTSIGSKQIFNTNFAFALTIGTGKDRYTTTAFLQGFARSRVQRPTDNNIVTSRDGQIYSSALPCCSADGPRSRTPSDPVFGRASDTITLSKANGALPAAVVRRRRRHHHRLRQRYFSARPATTSCWARAAVICCSAVQATTR